MKQSCEILNIHNTNVCPNCGVQKIKCIETRDKGRRERVRMCDNCKYKFKTIEISEDDIKYLEDIVKKYRDIRIRLKQIGECL